MKILLGDSRSRKVIKILRSLRWGRMCLVQKPDPYPYEWWGFDNGAFPLFLKGLPFDEIIFQKRLDAALTVLSDPGLAVVPDIVCGGLHSLDFSMKWITKLPARWPWYLAVQDGMEPADIEPVGHLFTGIFLGGSGRFKGRAFTWCKFAHAHNLKFHYARAGTLDKVKHAYQSIQVSHSGPMNA